jgi:hypothetical protein
MWGYQLRYKLGSMTAWAVASLDIPGSESSTLLWLHGWLGGEGLVHVAVLLLDARGDTQYCICVSVNLTHHPSILQ